MKSRRAAVSAADKPTRRAKSSMSENGWRRRSSRTFAARAGFSLNVTQEANQMQTVVSLVSSGLGVAVVPASVANLGRRGVAYQKLADKHPALELWLAWRAANVGPAAAEFIRLASETK